jgi:RNA polymerase sigma factor (sigma-70 family)
MGERIRGSSLNEALEQADSLTISELDLFPPDSIWEKEEMKNIVKRAVRGLPPRRRTVLELHLAGMKLEEMAAFLGWTDNQVRHLLYRGKEE